MAQKVMKVGVRKANGYLYFVDKQGDVSRAPMARGGVKKGRPEKVGKAGVTNWDPFCSRPCWRF